MTTLFILNKPPYQSEQTKEALDMALSLAAFDSRVALLFAGDGVWNLVEDQAPKQQGMKEFTRLYKGLDLYDIEELYVEQTALENYQLTEENLMIPIQSVHCDAEFIQRFAQVICL
ncbi:sulfurtransferase complex subunit TusC [Pleionea sp. CnH1-48]|uniref:sulfurtransferase complex subunit TusC n=1 Tax=Pleionea sp. CnH1-48 TaxID=2954494 RepID=UPI0020969D8F|nr:sulfurtransferase complex subunit TusC [Pleionea sp. CnH1-48]MCO7222748.1 sulfurtransferase complex subunit TusC [Pleionea sp. CnH1-48]